MSFTFEKTDSDEILPVSRIMIDGEEVLLKCPHCGRIRSIDNETGNVEDLEGEQYQDNLCDGWFTIAESRTFIRDVEEL